MTHFWSAVVLTSLVPLASAEERIVVGLSEKHAAIEAVSVPGPAATSPTVIMLGGLEGGSASVRVNEEVRRFEAIPQSRRRFRLVAIPLANPDSARLAFPPAGIAYRENATSHALWRWIGIQAPDLVLTDGTEDSGLAAALRSNAVAGIGSIPARPGTLRSIKNTLSKSEAHLEIERRLSRTPRQVAEQLGQVYGHDFNEAVYILGVALIGQLRLGNLTEVEKLAAPYRDGTKNSLQNATGSHLAGHLVFAELAARTGDARYAALVRKAADLGFAPSGEMLEAMPFHNEMSDALFMGCPISAWAGKLTGERKYFDMAARNLAFVRGKCLRPDGLYRHSPLNEAAWGRGNAFPTLGLAFTLSVMPADHPAFGEMLREFQDHMAALAKFQDAEGMWHEVIDLPGAYAEYTATAMIGASMLRGVRNGWLPRDTYKPRVDRAWQAILKRTAPDGRLIDVCESTGKQKTLKDYLQRAAILGRDPRGGAMGLLFATEVL